MIKLLNGTTLSVVVYEQYTRNNFYRMGGGEGEEQKTKMAMTVFALQIFFFALRLWLLLELIIEIPIN